MCTVGFVTCVGPLREATHVRVRVAPPMPPPALAWPKEGSMTTLEQAAALFVDDAARLLDLFDAA